MIECKNISFGYDNPKKNNYIELIHNISLKINDGEFIAITGENGAGKSTLSKLIAGLLKPVNGSIYIEEIDTICAKNSLIAKFVGFLFQNPDRQLCCYTVYDEIAFGMKALKIFSENQIKERVNQIIEEFNFDAKEPPFALSRGERQRLALACIIAVNPKIMILDEPTTGLDYIECMQIMQCVKKMNQNGTTVIMVCHDMELVIDFADRMIVLQKGNIIADGNTKKIMYQTDILKKACLLPPQIIQVAIELGKTHPTFLKKQKEFIYSVETFTDAIQNYTNLHRNSI